MGDRRRPDAAAGARPRGPVTDADPAAEDPRQF